MSFTHFRPDVGVLFVRGRDAVSFIDGLSTNHIPKTSGSALRTVFTDRAAKVIAVATVLVREEGVVLLVHREQWHALLEHLTPRQLGQDVAMLDLSDRNDVVYRTGSHGSPVGTWLTEEGVTSARVHHDLCILVVAASSNAAHAQDHDAWTAWRVVNRWPEVGLEITSKHHPYACGLESLVHENKGCYLGQEVLTRMRSRGKTGWVLVQGSTENLPENRITTSHQGRSLAIVRTSEVQ